MHGQQRDVTFVGRQQRDPDQLRFVVSAGSRDAQTAKRRAAAQLGCSVDALRVEGARREAQAHGVIYGALSAL